jgi:hypothetical protein
MISRGQSVVKPRVGVNQNGNLIFRRNPLDGSVNCDSQAGQTESHDDPPIQNLIAKDEKEHEAAHQEGEAERTLGDYLVPKEAAAGTLEKIDDQALSS